MSDLLKEAIADAKAVRETALQNAKMALQEAFTPQLKSMLSAKLREEEPFEDEEEAVILANDTVYGLAAGIWTGDVTRAIRIAERIQAGTIYVNNYFNSATQSPVGGYKQSGYGRENGIEGMLSFMQTKSVWLSTQSGTPNPFG